MRPLCCIEISETKHLVIHRLVPEEQIPHSHDFKQVNGVLIVVTINFGFSVEEKCG
jgi:hypothetical protein